MKKVMGLLVILCVSSANFAFAENDNSKLYFLSEQIILNLNTLEKGSEVSNHGIPEDVFISNQQRHVVRIARSNLIKLNELKRLNWLEYNSIEHIPADYSWPDDAVSYLYSMLQGISTLYDVYGAETSAITKETHQDHTVEDVYRNMIIISRKLDNLLQIEDKPSSVYQMVVTLVNDLSKICSSLPKCQLEIKQIQEFDKRPEHVYEKLYASLLTLSDLNNAIQYTDRVILLPKPKNAVIPSDVKKLANYILQEVVELKKHLKITTPAKIADYEAGKTPTDVYKQVSKASLLMQNIKEAVILAK